MLITAAVIRVGGGFFSWCISVRKINFSIGSVPNGLISYLKAQGQRTDLEHRDAVDSRVLHPRPRARSRGEARSRRKVQDGAGWSRCRKSEKIEHTLGYCREAFSYKSLME